MLVNFLEKKNHFAMNIFFKKRSNQKCTWGSSDLELRTKMTTLQNKIGKKGEHKRTDPEMITQNKKNFKKNKNQIKSCKHK